jgi:hypothetical protein
MNKLISGDAEKFRLLPPIVAAPFIIIMKMAQYTNKLVVEKEFIEFNI